VRSAGILIRPHPNNVTHFMANDFSVFGDVAVWPPFEANRLDPLHETDYFESMFYCAAAVGVNTSGMIEAAIVGRPVHTVLAPDFTHAQRGTLHFEQLMSAGGGLLHVAQSLDEHVGKLHESIAAGGVTDSRSAAFVAAFVRPLGLTRPAGPELAQAIESMADLRRAAVDRDPLPHRLIRPTLFPVAAVASLICVSLDRPWWIWLVKPGVGIWVAAVRVRHAVLESPAWAAAQSAIRKTRSMTRHVGKDLLGVVRSGPRRLHRAWMRAWAPAARRLRTTEHTVTLARKRLRRSARELPKRIRKRVRVAARVVGMQLARLK